MDIITSVRKPTELEIRAAKLRKQKHDRTVVGFLALGLIVLAIAFGRL
jgi:hypothetical protein